MKNLPIIFLIAFMGLAYSPLLHAQRTVERYENGNKKFQGREVKGVKLGKHTYWYEDGSKQKEEKYNERGILIHVREWDEEGNIVKDENPEEGFEKIRMEQFKNLLWNDTPSGIAFHKIIGNNDLMEPINNRTDLVIHYATFLTDGKEVDNSFRAKQPIKINLKKNDLIDGLIKGLMYFEEGDNGFIRVPPKLAYGDEGTQNVPPNSTLVFQVYILKVT